MNLCKISKKESGFEYVYAINYREDFLRASVTINTDLDGSLKSIKYMSSVYGVAQFNKENIFQYGYLWESEDDAAKQSELSRHYTALLDKKEGELSQEQINRIINDCLSCADDLELVQFIRSRKTAEEVNVFPEFNYSLGSPVKSNMALLPEQVIKKEDHEGQITQEVESRSGKGKKILTHLRQNVYKYLNLLFVIVFAAYYFMEHSFLKEPFYENEFFDLADARLWVKKGDIEKAKLAYLEVLYQNPESCEIAIELVDYAIFTNSGLRDISGWINSQYYTFNPAMQVALAYVDIKEKEQESARRKLYQLSEIKSMQKCVYHLMGNMAIHENSERAKNLYLKALQLDPKYVFADLNLSLIYGYSGNEKLAVEYLNKARDLEPGYYLPYFYLGNYYFAKGKYAKAKEAFEVALKKNPKLQFAQMGLNQVELKLRGKK